MIDINLIVLQELEWDELEWYKINIENEKIDDKYEWYGFYPKWFTDTDYRVIANKEFGPIDDSYLNVRKEQVDNIPVEEINNAIENINSKHELLDKMKKELKFLLIDNGEVQD